MLQDTGKAQVSFLWMDVTVPLALALLTAAVGAIPTVGVGAARIVPLRRPNRRLNRHRIN